ncbi:Lar family restriction alleviation protein [Candidatus Pacearchaeota archaeon]|nr:Lar family restriction alleviation protein [Candidatus Pacearchaeota archaeon]
MSEKLKPCPFCGGEAELSPFGFGPVNEPSVLSGMMACCKNEKCSCTIMGDTEAEAIAAWNHRPAPDTDLLEACKMALECDEHPDTCKGCSYFSCGPDGLQGALKAAITKATKTD